MVSRQGKWRMKIHCTAQFLRNAKKTMTQHPFVFIMIKMYTRGESLIWMREWMLILGRGKNRKWVFYLYLQYFVILKISRKDKFFSFYWLYVGIITVPQHFLCLHMGIMFSFKKYNEWIVESKRLVKEFSLNSVPLRKQGIWVTHKLSKKGRDNRWEKPSMGWFLQVTQLTTDKSPASASSFPKLPQCLLEYL